MTRLNLLPSELKKEIELSKMNAKIAQNLWRLLAVFFIVLGVLIIVGTFVMSKKTINQAENTAVAAQVNDWKGTENDAKDFATRLNIISKIEKGSLDWPLVLTEVSKSTPSNLRLISMNFTGNGTKRITFTGVAASDTDVVTFRELLSKSKIFEYVDIESIAEGSDPTAPAVKLRAFTVTANMKQNEVLKGNEK